MQLQALPCASSLHLRVPDLVLFRKWEIWTAREYCNVSSDLSYTLDRACV